MVALIKIRVGCVPIVRHGTVDKETSISVTDQKLVMPRYCAHRAATQNQKLRHKTAETPLGHVCLRRWHCSLKRAHFGLQ
jgi:hypothetical protein